MFPINDGEDVEDVLEHYGELMVVLESDREYALHPHDTTVRRDYVRTEGIEEGGSEYLTVEFPIDAIEHWYTHAEL